MKSILKILFGAILLIGSISLVITDSTVQDAMIIAIKAGVPAFLGLVGLFIIWLELDEMKIERSIKASKK